MLDVGDYFAFQKAGGVGGDFERLWEGRIIVAVFGISFVPHKGYRQA